MDWSECSAQAEMLLKEASQSRVVAGTQVERQEVRDLILMGLAYATLAQVKRG